MLWITDVEGRGLDVRLNRVGTIQVWGRADGQSTVDWRPTEWIDYLSADPKEFVVRLERAAGLSSSGQVPQSTPTTITYRVLAALAGFGSKTVHPIEIEQGFIDSSDEGGPNQRLEQFTIPSNLADPRREDFFDQPGYRFWMPVRDDKPLAAIEQTSATAWFLDGAEPLDLMAAYRSLAKEPTLVAAAVLQRAVGIRNC